ncbi:signal recognition particle-docking protein FtsY [Streptococcus orisratti]|uniref:signal recognition particle-docking protein FtsY n=1 Tax=Streptococcus orisratti TaxID=114652 RepID=UPI0023F72DC7|nr:signal recognition particle-docking protein FtsY [Streptococcus orisratti]
MGLFDRLFGKKNQEEKTQEEISEQLTEPTTSENSQAETVLETLDISQESEKAEHDLATAGQEEVKLESPSLAQKDKAEDEETELVVPDLSKKFREENLEVSSEAKSQDDIVEETHDNVFQEENSNQNLKEDNNSHTQESQSESAPKNDAAALFMADYYSKKAALEKSIADGTYVKSEENKVEVEQVHHQREVPAIESEEEKYNRSLKKTRTGFAARLNEFFANFRRVDEDFFEELEELLILSDVGVNVATQLTEDLRYEAKLENAKKPEALKRVIIEKLVDIYEKDGIYNEKINFQDDLTVMLFVGVNGVGKTTSIGKLAYKYKNQGKKVMLVAADTFRAGAVAQLVEWGRRVDVPVVIGPEKADPASVVFDGMERAVSEDVDILLIDTAGRLQNKDNLMAELEKIGRIIKRVVPEAPHETLLALDASTGQNALSQAKEFSKITPLTGLILTKIDGTAKGGVVLAIRQDLDIPVKFIGFGEKVDDIGEFNSEDFMRGLLEGII